MTFPTALKWEHEQFDTLVWQRTEWRQLIIKGILTWWSLPSAFHFPQSDDFHPHELLDLCQLCFILSYLSFCLNDWALVMIQKKVFLGVFPPPVLFINYPFPHDVFSYLQLRIVPTEGNTTTEGNCLRKKNLEQII